MLEQHYDWIIIGSGFGGSVSAHRLTQKGYKVLVIEKGRRFKPEDFPKTNWDLKRWLWNPALGLRGFFQMSFMKHMTVYHGVGGVTWRTGRRSSLRTMRQRGACSARRRTP